MPIYGDTMVNLDYDRPLLDSEAFMLAFILASLSSNVPGTTDIKGSCLSHGTLFQIRLIKEQHYCPEESMLHNDIWKQ